MTKLRSLICSIALTGSLVPVSAISNDEVTIVGGDTYISESSSDLSIDMPRDAFVTGFSVSADGDVASDAHAMGFNIDWRGRVGGDFYAAGSNLSISGPVSEDVTAAAFSINLMDTANVGGNARLAGGTVRVAAPIAGSLVASGGAIKLNSVVSGDVRLTASNIEFGVNAVVGGTLTYSAPKVLTIPATVASSDQIRFIPVNASDYYTDIGKTIDRSLPSRPSFLTTVSTFLLTIAFLTIVAALFLAFTPERVKALRLRVREHPGLCLIAGFLGLSTLIGAIPVSGMTIVGLPLIPLVILLIFVMWLLGYLLGVYVIAMRLNDSFRNTPLTFGSKLLVLVAGLIGMALLNYIPVLGWILNLTIMFIGLGSISLSVISKLSYRKSHVANTSDRSL